MYILKFRKENRDIFEAIKRGEKKVETRAATAKFKNICAGDTLVMVCGKERFEKKVKSAKHFKTIKEMLAEYDVQNIDPRISTEKELITVYQNFPNYKEKIKKFGLMAFKL